MLVIKRYENNLTFQHRQLKTGLKMGKSDLELYKMRLEKLGCMISNLLEATLKKPQQPAQSKLNEKLPCSIAEFPVESKSPILKDKLTCYPQPSQKQKSSKILDPDLILNEKDSPKWWNEFVGEISQELSLPTKIDSCDLATTYSNKYVEKITAKSWFTVKNMNYLTLQERKKLENYKKIYSQLSMSSLLEEMEKEQVSLKKKEKDSKEAPNSLMKIKLYPTQNQKEKLNELFGAQRKVYNTIIEKSKQDIFDLSKSEFTKKYRYLTQKKTMHTEFNEYIYSKPEECFNSTFRDVTKAIITTKALSKALKKKNGAGFQWKELKFKSKKDPSNSIEIQSRSINSTNNYVRFWPTYFGFSKNEGIKIKELLPELNYSCRLQRTRSKDYFLCIPIYKEFKQSITSNMCALDPGIRTFQTVFSLNGESYELGTNFGKIIKKCIHIDKLRSILRNFKGKRNRRYNLKQKMLHVSRKVKNCIQDCHHKISKWLSEKYKYVFLPTFETQKLSKKQNRKISKLTTRSMMTWSHYRFKELLRYKMKRSGGELIDCTEEYTSKTCTRCGRINHNLGSNKVFTCTSCNLIIDRDVNGARNILLKNLGAHRASIGQKPTDQVHAT